MFLFKQGTTGNPKGATLSHHGILNNAYYVGEILNYENQVFFTVEVTLHPPRYYDHIISASEQKQGQFLD